MGAEFKLVDIKASLSQVIAGLWDILYAKIGSTRRKWKNPVLIPISEETMSTSPLNSHEVAFLDL